MPLSAVTSIVGGYRAMVVSDGTLVALDSQSDLYTSDDGGVSFTLRESTSDTFENLGALGMTTIAVGVDGLILRAPDAGITWSSSATSESIFGSLYAVAGRSDGVNPNKWIAVGDVGFDGFIYRSVDDGLNWTIAETLTDLFFEDAIWTGNRWLVCGRNNFTNEGVVYSSTDGTTWTPSTVPYGAAPLLGIAADLSGVALAVGVNGQILRSTDDGLTFTAIAGEYLGGGDFNAVVADSSGTFFVGGDEKQILEINGTTATTMVPAAAGAPSVLDLILIDDEAAAVGGFTASMARTIPFKLQFAAGGTLDYVLTIEQTLVGKTYYVETTTDLTASDWSILPNNSISGTGGAITFDVVEDDPRRFWRVVEF
jgi:photosystem II stability/assembly factor-like uncharacterized protein